MVKLAANLTMMFNEVGFLDRFEAAADAGFKAVEYLFPYDFEPDDIAERLRANGLEQALFNAPPGDWASGERGLAAIPGRQAEFRQSIAQVFPYAEATGVERVHVMAGLSAGDLVAARQTFRDNIAWAAEQFDTHGLKLLIEPINTRDMPGYFLDEFALAVALIDEIGAANVRLQFDIYHRQILHGDVTVALETLMPIIDHIQIAGVPERHEPDSGELDYAHVFATLDRLGYDGWVGCEYRPRVGTVEGLGWREKLVVAP